MRPTLYATKYLILAFALAACSAAPRMKDEPSTEFAPAALYPVKSSGFAQAFVARDAKLSSYRSLSVTPLDASAVEIPQTQVMGTSRRDWLMTPEREKALQQAWAAALDQAFAGFTHAAAGPGVLEITAKMTRLAPGRPDATTVGGELLPGAASRDVVEVSMEFRLYRSEDGQLLAVIRDSRTMTAAAMSRTAPIGFDLLFRSWAALLRTRISGN